MATPEGNQEEKGTAGDPVDERIHQQAGRILRSYIIQSTRNDEPNVNIRPEELGGTQDDVEDINIKQIVGSLLQIGDELNKNVELLRLIDSVPLDSTREVFYKVYRGIFADGFDWGKVAVVLFFASKLVLKAIIHNCREMVSAIFSKTMNFLDTYVIRWIREQGGWESLSYNLVSMPWQNIAVAAAFAITAALAFLRS